MGSSISGVLSSINDAFSGKTNGIDVSSVVSQLMQVERQPETQMQNQQSDIQAQIGLLNSLSGDLFKLNDAVNSLKDSFGALSLKTVTSSQPGLATATADYTAAPGTHSITVGQMATVSSGYSADALSPTGSLAGKNISITYGDPQTSTHSDSITIPATATTLQAAVDYINSSSNKFGVTASLVTDSTGTRLVFTSKTSGSAGNLTVTGDLSFKPGTVGQDALLTVDGVPVVGNSNTVTGVIPGVTLNLGAAAPDTPFQVSVAPDTNTAATTVGNFMDAYNTVVKDINTQYTVGADGNEGPLAADSALRVVQEQLLSAVSFSATGTGRYVNLHSMGIEMQDDGTLKLNNSVINDTLTNHYAEFQNFFQSVTPQGFGQSVGKVLLQMTDLTEGPVQVDIAGLKSTSAGLTNTINDFEARMSLVQQQLTQQYANLNALLQQYPMQIQQITNQLGSLTPTNSK